MNSQNFPGFWNLWILYTSPHHSSVFSISPFCSALTLSLSPYVLHALCPFSLPQLPGVLGDSPWCRPRCPGHESAAPPASPFPGPAQRKPQPGLGGQRRLQPLCGPTPPSSGPGPRTAQAGSQPGAHRKPAGLFRGSQWDLGASGAAWVKSGLRAPTSSSSSPCTPPSVPSSPRHADLSCCCPSPSKPTSRRARNKNPSP